jgi:hypothetical protein
MRALRKKEPRKVLVKFSYTEKAACLGVPPRPPLENASKQNDGAK